MAPKRSQKSSLMEQQRARMVAASSNPIVSLMDRGSATSSLTPAPSTSPDPPPTAPPPRAPPRGKHPMKGAKKGAKKAPRKSTKAAVPGTSHAKIKRRWKPGSKFILIILLILSIVLIYLY